MDLNQYQKKALKFAVYPDIGCNLNYTVVGLCGEAGEVANKFGKVIRDHDGKISEEMRESLMDEAGDCLWFLSMICTELGYNLDDIAKRNLDKLRSRNKRSVISGSGDHR